MYMRAFFFRFELIISNAINFACGSKLFFSSKDCL